GSGGCQAQEADQRAAITSHACCRRRSADARNRVGTSRMNDWDLPRRLSPEAVEQFMRDLDDCVLKIDELSDAATEQLREFDLCLDRHPTYLVSAAKALAQPLREYQGLFDAVAGLNDEWQAIGRFEAPPTPRGDGDDDQEDQWWRRL